MEKERNPICEEALEHGLIFCLNLKKEEKTLDDLIKHLQYQLKIIKQERFEKNENEIDSIISRKP